VDWTFRGRRFHISVQNPGGVQKWIESHFLNGKKIRGNLVPLEETDKENEIIAVMGKPS
jgi:hypothetical protein